MNTISDMLTRIRNAQMAGHKEVTVAYSNLKIAIAKILQDEGYIEQYRKDVNNGIPNIVIELKYHNVAANKKAPAISGIKQISKSGKRFYIKKKDIRKTKQGYGISIISTSKGVMTADEAKKQGVGGELICEIW